MRLDRAIDLSAQAVRLDRNASGWMWHTYGESLVMAGRHEEAISILLKALTHGARGTVAADTHLALAVAYDAIGENENAAMSVKNAREAVPLLTLSVLRRTSYFSDQDYKERWLANLKRLGLPEE